MVLAILSNEESPLPNFDDPLLFLRRQNPISHFIKSKLVALHEVVKLSRLVDRIQVFHRVGKLAGVRIDPHEYLARSGPIKTSNRSRCL